MFELIDHHPWWCIFALIIICATVESCFKAFAYRNRPPPAEEDE